MNNESNKTLNNFAYSKYIDNNIAKLFDLRKNQSSNSNKRENNCNDEISEEAASNFEKSPKNFSKPLNKTSNEQKLEDDNIYTRKYRRSFSDKTNPEYAESKQNSNTQAQFVVQVPSTIPQNFGQKSK